MLVSMLVDYSVGKLELTLGAWHSLVTKLPAGMTCATKSTSIAMATLLNNEHSNMMPITIGTTTANLPFPSSFA